MKVSKKPLPNTLGKYLEAGRHEAGFSLRQLAKATGIHESAVNRLLKDEVAKPSAEHVQQLVRVLELNLTDALAYIGVVRPRGLPDTRLYLREKQGLKGQALDEATKAVDGLLKEIADKYNKP